MKKIIILSLLPFSVVFLVILLFSSNAFAHPGGLAADGCHYCRTNCAKWGEVQGARHCHGSTTGPSSSDDDSNWLGWIIFAGIAGIIGYGIVKKRDN